MSREEARSHLRAAQEAEIAGNKDAAVRHLERAALVYVRSRQHKRAVSMYEHCLRLAPGREDLRLALRTAQEWAEKEENGPAPALVLSPELAQAMAEAAGEAVEAALVERKAEPHEGQAQPASASGPSGAQASSTEDTASFDLEAEVNRPEPTPAPRPARPSQPPRPASTPAPSRPSSPSEAPRSRVASGEGFDAQAFQRGPTRAPADVDAWCSFCCRPMRETGPLAQGPAGAFVCVSCLEASGKLLGREAPLWGKAPASSGAPAPSARPASVPPETKSVARTWVGPDAVRELAKAALLVRAGPLVITGPVGSGKTALLAELAAMFPGAVRVDLARGDVLPTGPEPLLVDHLEAASAQRWAALAGRPFVAALRGEFEVRPLLVKAGERQVELPAALAELPAGFPFAAAVALPEASAELLGELLERAAAQLPPLELTPGLKEALVARALKAGRGAHGLLAEAALLRGLGESGPLESAAPEKKGRRKKP